MAVKVALSGFGRAGRLVFRQLSNDKEFEVVAINETAKPELLAYLLKYDLLPFRNPSADKIGSGSDSISFRGKTIKIYRETEFSKLPWKRLGVDLVLECGGDQAAPTLSAGSPDIQERTAAHLAAGARKVLTITVRGEDMPAIVLGVNEDHLSPREKVVFTFSASVNCLALLINALHSYAPIQSGITVILRPSTGEPFPSGTADESFRLFRTGPGDLVPEPDNSAQLIGQIIPELQGKLAGSVQRIPPVSGSAVLLTAVVKGKDLNAEGINRAMKGRSSKSLGYTEEEIISSDLEGIGFGALFDAKQTLAVPLGEDLVEVHLAAWYSPESSYAGQLIRTIKYITKLTEKPRGKADPRKVNPSPTVPVEKNSGAVLKKTYEKPPSKKKNENGQNNPLPRKPLIKYPT